LKPDQMVGLLSLTVARSAIQALIPIGEKKEARRAFERDEEELTGGSGIRSFRITGGVSPTGRAPGRDVGGSLRGLPEAWA
jgi:hypothetical protein